MSKAIPTNTNSLQTNVIMMFAAAILAAIIAVAVASILIANRIDAISQNNAPATQLAHAVTPAATSASSGPSCDVPAAGGGDHSAVLSSVRTVASGHGNSHHTTGISSHHGSHTSTNTYSATNTTSGNTGNTGNSGFVNVPVNVSGNSVLSDNLNNNQILNNNDVLSENEVNVLNGNTLETTIPVLNLVGNQVGPTGLLTSIL